MSTPLPPSEAEVAALLSSPVAADRAEGAALVGEQGLGTLVPRVRALLGDDAPYTFPHGPRAMIGEVRSAALVALQAIYRRARRAPDFGPVTVRRAMPADEAIGAAAGLPAAAWAAADTRLAERVRPDPADREAARAYAALQAAGKVDYRVEEVDPRDWLTPLQREVSASQLQSQRPRPHLRVATAARPDETAGFVYREGTRWVFDFAEGAPNQRARAFFREILRADRAGMSRPARDAQGRPRRNADGSLVLDGTIPLDTPDPTPVLSALAAFAAPEWYAELVR